MSKIKLLLDVVNDMRSLADSLQSMANAMADGDVQKKGLPASKTTEKEQTNSAFAKNENKEPAVTHEILRELAVKLSRSGRREEIKALLDKYGVKNITSVSNDDITAFYSELQGLDGDA